MSQEVAVKINLDGGNSVQKLEQLETVLNDIKKNTNVGNVNAQFEKLNATIDEGGNSVEDLRRAIKSYQTIALTSGRTSPIGKEALQRSAQLRDQLTDLDNEVKRLANDHKNLQGAMEIGTSVIAGYSAFQGVTAMLGDENEELMKTMVKLQGVQSAMNGLMQIRQSFEKESASMQLIQTVRTKALTASTILYNGVMKGATLAMKLFRGALIATGLGAIVVLIGTLIANWDSWKESIMSFINSALAPMMPLLQALGIVESENDKIRREAHENRVAELEEEMEMQKMKLDAVTKQYDFEIAKARAVGKETFELEKKKLEAVLDRAEKEGKAIVELFKLNRNLTEDQLARANELGDFIKKSKNDLELLELSHNHKIEEAGKKSNQRKRKEQDTHNKEMLKLQQAFEDLMLSKITDESERKLATQQIEFEREKQQLIDQYGEKSDLINSLERIQEEKRLALIKEIELAQEEADKVTEEKKAEKKKQQDEEVLENAQALNEQLMAGMQKVRETSEQEDEAMRLSKQQNLDMTSKLLGDMSGLFEKNSKESKAFAVAQASIDTAMAISSAIRYAQANPLNGPTGGVAGAIQYATNLVSILSNMKRVYSLLKSGSSVSAPSTGGSSRSSGSTRDSANGSLTGRQNTGSTEFVDNEKGMSKVVVVESEVNAVRERANQIDVISSI